MTSVIEEPERRTRRCGTAFPTSAELAEVLNLNSAAVLALQKLVHDPLPRELEPALQWAKAHNHLVNRRALDRLRLDIQKRSANPSLSDTHLCALLGLLPQECRQLREDCDPLPSQYLEVVEWAGRRNIALRPDATDLLRRWGKML